MDPVKYTKSTSTVDSALDRHDAVNCPMPTTTKPTARILSREHEGDDSPVIRSDRVRRQIADQIISGALRPGQELDEKKLAEAFNVSRTPVREALRQLAAASLVDWRAHPKGEVAQNH